MPDHTGASYQGIAGQYARLVDTSPMNACYERPAVLSLLPALAQSRVLDAGCGSGWYTEYLLGQGATVTACDLNAEFVALTRQRVGGHATVRQADLTRPLDFAAAGAFDTIVCPLVLHYLQIWQPTLHEFARVLRPQGVLVFSTHHPCMDWQMFQTGDYFALTLLEDTWEAIGMVQFYRRPLTAISEALDAAGFVIERLLEPQPTADFQRVAPDLYERVMRNPWFLVVRARKAGSV